MNRIQLLKEIFHTNCCYARLIWPKLRACLPLVTAICIGTAVISLMHAQSNATSVEEPPAPIISLKKMPIPGPSSAALATIVQDKTAAIQLGKALFWDTRVGSDNKTACASCHFHAGADNRTKNQINPGLLANDKTFQLGPPNSTLTAASFPLTRHANPDDASTRLSDINDVISSQGVLTTTFDSSGHQGQADRCTAQSDAVLHGGSGFNVNGVNTRRVEPRNAPSVFNAVFNFRNFWDGRGNPMLNGVDPFGLRNADARVWRRENGIVRPVQMALASSSLASVASGPPLSENEMSCRNRSFVNLARKLGDSVVLADQTISADDSVLAPLAVNRPTYAMLVRRAFRPEYWQSIAPIQATGAEGELARSVDLEKSRPGRRHRHHGGRDQWRQDEANFSLFFSLAIQLYQATLVSDETPFDRFAAGDKSALTAQQVRGLATFRSRGQCLHCHAGAEFTSASVSNIVSAGRLDDRLGANQTVFRYDNGFFNTGVRPTADDIGLGGLDPFGNPLSETRIVQAGKQALLGNDFDLSKELPITADALTAIDGAFKTPGLRNVELTGPYFHNGGKSTLMQVIDFYNRGGDFATENQPIPDPTIRPLGLSQIQKNELVAFLLALTDERVRYERAPFDHPSICVPHGHASTANGIKVDAAGNAVDIMQCIAAVGATGAVAPLQPFLQLDPFSR